MSFNSDDEEIKQTDIENFFKSVQMPNEASEESLEVCEIKEKKEETKDISKMKKDELLVVASEKGIEVPDNVTKEVLVALIKEVEEKKEEADK